MNHDDGDIITMRNVGIPFDHNRTVVSRLPFLAPLQMVYELNNAVALFSGEAQRDFFTALCGDPSPSGRAVMPLDDLTLRIAEEVAVSHAAFR